MAACRVAGEDDLASVITVFFTVFLYKEECILQIEHLCRENILIRVTVVDAADRIAAFKLRHYKAPFAVQILPAAAVDPQDHRWIHDILRDIKIGAQVVAGCVFEWNV